MTTAVPSGYVPAFLSTLTQNIQGRPNLFTYYDSSNNPDFTNTQINTGIASGATGGDSAATIEGANYISDGQKRGMGLGSVVLVITDYVSVGTDVLHIMFVTAVQATSSGYGVTLSAYAGS